MAPSGAVASFQQCGAAQKRAMRRRVLPALPPALLKSIVPAAWQRSLAAHYNAIVVSSLRTRIVLSDALAVEEWYCAGAFAPSECTPASLDDLGMTCGHAATFASDHHALLYASIVAW